MKFCGITCFVATVFLIANIYTMFCIGCEDSKNNFIKLLNKKQNTIYKNIIKERRDIYFKGYGIGLFLSFIFIVIYRNLLSNKNRKISIWVIVCLVGAITLTSNYLFYILSPKTTYMIEHLNSKQQIDAWLNIYRTMQVKYHTGLVLGIVAAMLFAYANKC